MRIAAAIVWTYRDAHGGKFRGLIMACIVSGSDNCMGIGRDFVEAATVARKAREYATSYGKFEAVSKHGFRIAKQFQSTLLCSESESVIRNALESEGYRLTSVEYRNN